MQFLRQQFKQQIEKPYKQLKSITTLWRELMPAALVGHTRLDSLSRGVLRVTADSAPCCYEVDRLLRNGLEQALIRRHKGPAFRRVQVRVGPIDPPARVPASPDADKE